MLTRPTSSPSAALQTSISEASLVTSIASSTPSTTSDRPSSSGLQSSKPSSPLSISKISPTNAPDLGTGAIAGIVVGAVVVCAGLAAALILIFYRLRKSKNIQTELPASFQSHVPATFVEEKAGSPLRSTYFQPDFPANFVEEKDGSPLGPNELDGGCQLLEMATNNL